MKCKQQLYFIKTIYQCNMYNISWIIHLIIMWKSKYTYSILIYDMMLSRYKVCCLWQTTTTTTIILTLTMNARAIPSMWTNLTCSISGVCHNMQTIKGAGRDIQYSSTVQYSNKQIGVKLCKPWISKRSPQSQDKIAKALCKHLHEVVAINWLQIELHPVSRCLHRVILLWVWEKIYKTAR